MTKEQMEFSIMDRTIQSIQTEFQVISSRKISNFSFRLKMVVPAGTHLRVRVPPPLSTLAIWRTIFAVFERFLTIFGDFERFFPENIKFFPKKSIFYPKNPESAI